MSKKYALISNYGDLLVPISLLEKIVDQCYLVTTTYGSNHNSKKVIDEVRSIERFEVYSQTDLDAAIVQQKLSSDE